jgi:hypothetical protein
MINHLFKQAYRKKRSICKVKKINMKLEHIPAKACPGLDPGLHDFADKDLLQPLV